MNDDPKRLLDPGGDATEFERRLLETARDVAPQDKERGPIWAAIVAQIPALPPPVAPGPAAGAAGVAGKGLVLAKLLGSGGAIKMSVAAVVVAGAVLGTRAAIAPRSDRSTIPAVPAPPVSAPASRLVLPVPPAQVQAEPAAPAPAVAPIVGPDRPAAPASKSPPHKAAVDPSRLAEELALLDEARANLQAGDADRALSVLARSEQRFPRGALEEERRALRVEALAKAGQEERARVEATQFRADYPKSPYGARVAGFE
jgi:hypothetical protein